MNRTGREDALHDGDGSAGGDLCGGCGWRAGWVTAIVMPPIVVTIASSTVTIAKNTMSSRLRARC